MNSNLFLVLRVLGKTNYSTMRPLIFLCLIWLSACDSPVSAPLAIEGKWKFVTYTYGKVNCPAEGMYISFEKVGGSLEFQGKSFLNTYFGSTRMLGEGKWEMAGELGTTKIGGAPAEMACEMEFYELLKSSDRYKIEGNRLHIWRDAPLHSSKLEEILVFERL